MIPMIKIVEKAAEMSGGIVELSRQLGIKHNSMYCWNRVPAEHVLKIERITGVSRHDIRPDVFGEAKKVSR